MASKHKQSASVLDRIMGGLKGPRGSASSDEDPRATERKAASAARGAGGNFGIAERAAGALLDGSRPASNQNTYTGMSAGDSLEKDAKNAAQSYPTANRVGSEMVSTPLAVAGSAALPVASYPAAALSDGAIGAAHGAYTAADGSDRKKAAAWGAGIGAAAPLAEAVAGKLGLRLKQLETPARVESPTSTGAKSNWHADELEAGAHLSDAQYDEYKKWLSDGEPLGHPPPNFSSTPPPSTGAKSNWHADELEAGAHLSDAQYDEYKKWLSDGEPLGHPPPNFSSRSRPRP